MKLAGGTQITVVTPSFLLVPPALATWNLRIPFSQVFPIINRVISSQSWTLKHLRREDYWERQPISQMRKLSLSEAKRSGHSQCSPGSHTGIKRLLALELHGHLIFLCLHFLTVTTVCAQRHREAEPLAWCHTTGSTISGFRTHYRLLGAHDVPNTLLSC